MKSYGQYCALARALDVIGDRWTLLLVRELLTGPCRYSDLRLGLPGIATNLLADRLRQLEVDGVVEHDGDRYALTPWGTALAPVLDALVRWGMPLMVSGQGDDEFRPHWLELALPSIFRGARLDRAVTADLAIDGHVVTLTVGPDGLTLSAPAAPADLTLGGPPDQVLGVLVGEVGLDDAPEVRLAGSRAALRRLVTSVTRPTPTAVTKSGSLAPIS
jgi:DNA-binding HxlR family transcriptional regulator